MINGGLEGLLVVSVVKLQPPRWLTRGRQSPTPIKRDDAAERIRNSSRGPRRILWPVRPVWYIIQYRWYIMCGSVRVWVNIGFLPRTSALWFCRARTPYASCKRRWAVRRGRRVTSTSATSARSGVWRTNWLSGRQTSFRRIRSLQAYDILDYYIYRVLYLCAFENVVEVEKRTLGSV